MNSRRRHPIFASRHDELEAALDRIGDYLQSGRRKELSEALEAESLSLKTVMNWLGDRSKTEGAYKAQNLIRLLDRLPPLNDPRFDAYKFALSELDVSIHSQKDVQKFQGNYNLLHRFGGRHTQSIKFLRIETRLLRGLNVFGVHYRVNKQTVKCDGFAFIRANRLYLFGLSPSTSFFSIFKTVTDPKRAIIFGTTMIEDLTDEEVWISQTCLCSVDLELKQDQLELIEQHLSQAAYRSL